MNGANGMFWTSLPPRASPSFDPSRNTRVLLPNSSTLYRDDPRRPYAYKLNAYPDAGTTWRCSGPVADDGSGSAAGIGGRMCPNIRVAVEGYCTDCTRNLSSGICSKLGPDGKRRECPDKCCGSLRDYYRQNGTGAQVDATMGTFRNTPCDGFRRMYVSGRGQVCAKYTWDGQLKIAPSGCCNAPPPWIQQQPLFEWEKYSRDPQYYGMRSYTMPYDGQQVPIYSTNNGISMYS